jgi:hypothetical protein
MANVKPEKEIVSYRGPRKFIGWARQQAEDNGTTLSVIISIALREKMEREREAQAAKDRALAPAGA